MKLLMILSFLIISCNGNAQKQIVDQKLKMKVKVVLCSPHIKHNKDKCNYPNIYRLENDEVICYYNSSRTDAMQCKFKGK